MIQCNRKNSQQSFKSEAFIGRGEVSKLGLFLRKSFKQLFDSINNINQRYDSVSAWCCLLVKLSELYRKSLKGFIEKYERNLFSAGLSELLMKPLVNNAQQTMIFHSQVSTSTGVISHFVNLQVVVPEAFILGSGELHVDMGSAINLVCIIEKVCGLLSFSAFFISKSSS